MAAAITTPICAKAFADIKTTSPNNKVTIGMMGLGGRGNYLLTHLVNMPDVEIKYLCDVDTRKFSRARITLEEADRKKPEIINDFRRMLDDKKLDAIVNATPPHWHALGTIMACQAGKDVYVEKPTSIDIWQGKKMVQATEKYGRVVQTGMQNRSAPYVFKAKDYIDSGKLGKISKVVVYNMMHLHTYPKGKTQPIPKGLNWEMWCGPSPLVEYSPGRWQNSLWDFSIGLIWDDAIHQMDIARFLVGAKVPTQIMQNGLKHPENEHSQIPDTQSVIYEYDGFNMQMQASFCCPYMHKTPAGVRDADKFPDWKFNGTRVEIYGSEQFMFFSRHGGGWQVFDKDNKVVASEFGRQSVPEHLRNFVDCIRTRKKPNGDIREAHDSMLLSHAANISYRLGNKALSFDADKENFINCDQANRLLKKDYRKPWAISEEV
jgi:predicted dehydrogenase